MFTSFLVLMHVLTRCPAFTWSIQGALRSHSLERALWMAAVWIGIFSAGGVHAEGAYASSPCDSLLNEIAPLHQRIDARISPETPPDGSRRLLRLSRAAQTCVLQQTPPSESPPWAPFVSEMSALHALGWHDDALAAFEIFFTTHAKRFPTDRQAAAFIRRGWTFESRGDAMMAASNFLRAYRTQTDWNVREQANVLLQIAGQLDGVLDRASEKRILSRYEEQALALLQSADDSLRATPAWKSDWAFALSRRAQSTDSSESLGYGRRAVAALSPDVNRLTHLYAYRTYAYRLIQEGQFEESRIYLRRIRSLLPDIRSASRRTSYRATLSAFSGRIDLKRERFASAAQHFRDALHTYRSSAALARSATTAAFLLGRAHERREEWDAAASAYRDGLSLADSVRTSVQGTDWSALSTRQWRGLYRGLTRIALQRGDPEAAFRWTDRQRTTLIHELREQAAQTQHLPPQERDRYTRLTQRLQHIRTHLADAGMPENRRQALQDERLILDSKRQRLLAKASSKDQMSVDELQAVLQDERRTVVSYVLGPARETRDASPGSYAFIVTPDTLRSIPLPEASRDTIEADLASISPLFRSPDAQPSVERVAFDLRPLHRLYQRLVKPIRSLLPPGRRLTIVPDGPLFFLPFAALVPSPPPAAFGPAAYGQTSYWGETHPLTTALSASLVADSLTHTRVRARDHAPDILAFGLSEFESQRSSSDVPLPLLRNARAALGDLPHVETELETVASTFASSAIRANDEATETAFHALDTPPHILHFASHALTNDRSPLYNALILASDSTAADTPSGDGMLHLHEIRSMNQRIPLVALNGCSTASGSLRSGTTMESLQSAFRAMGAQSTLASLWDTEDRAALALTTAFYQELREGFPKDVALQNAQQAYREAHPGNSPYFWATLTLYGSPQSLPLSTAFPVGWLLGLMGVVALLVSAVWAYQRRAWS